MIQVTRFASQCRFVASNKVSATFHISNLESNDSVDYFFEKAEPLLSHVRRTAKECWVPVYNLSVDELMITRAGKSSETVRMKSTPIAAGFKMYALAEHGYVSDFLPHSYRFSWKRTEIYKGQ